MTDAFDVCFEQHLNSRAYRHETTTYLSTVRKVHARRQHGELAQDSLALGHMSQHQTLSGQANHVKALQDNLNITYNTIISQHNLKADNGLVTT